MYTLCSFYSLFYTKIEKYGLDLFIFFLMVCIYDKRLIFIDSQFFSRFFWGKNKTLKVRTFSIGKTRVFGISGRVECSIYTFGRHSSGFIARPYPPCSQYWSNQCRGHQNNTLINEQIITTEQQFKFYLMNDR